MKKSVYEKSWNKNSLLAKFLLLCDSCDAADSKIDESDDYSGLSSTAYSIAGTAFSSFRYFYKPFWLLPLWFVVPVSIAYNIDWLWTLPFLRFIGWGVLGGFCYWRMLPWSNRSLAAAGGYENFPIPKCNIRQSVLIKRRDFKEAEKCIRAITRKKEFLESKPHERGHTFVGLAEIQLRNKQELMAKKSLMEALACAKGAEDECELNQAITVYKKAGNLAAKLDDLKTLSKESLGKAKELAEKTGAKDQLLKMGVS